MHQDFAVLTQIRTAAAQKSGKRKFFQLLGQLRPGSSGINKGEISFFRCFFNAFSALCGISLVISLNNVPSISKNNAFTQISSSSYKKMPKHLIFQGFRHFTRIEATGFEPTTSASRTQRSTKLSHASIFCFLNSRPSTIAIIYDVY